MPKTLTRKQLWTRLKMGLYSPLARQGCDIAEVLLTTGMKASHLAQLRWRDVDFEQNIVRIPADHAGDVRWVMFGPYVEELLLVWRGPVFSDDALVLGPNVAEVLDAAERQLRKAFELYDIPGVNFEVIENTSTKYGLARPAEAEPTEYIM